MSSGSLDELEHRLETLEDAAAGYAVSAYLPSLRLAGRVWDDRITALEVRLAALEAHLKS